MLDAKLIAQGLWSRRRASLYLALVVALTLLLSSLIVLGLLLHEDAWVQLGTALLPTALLVLAGFILISEAQAVSRTSNLIALRKERFRQIEGCVATSFDLHFPRASRRPTLDPRKIDNAKGVWNYRPRGPFLHVPEKRLIEYRSRWRNVELAEDGTLYFLYEHTSSAPDHAGYDSGPAEPIAPLQPIVVSVWQVGDQVRVGVFIDGDELQKAGNGNISKSDADDIAERCRELFLAPTNPEPRRRHERVLIETCRQKEALLLDSMLWDEVAHEVASVVVHSAIELINRFERVPARDGLG